MRTGHRVDTRSSGRRTRRVMLVSVFVVIAGLAVSSCARVPEPPVRPQRIVSLFPSWTEVLHALELGDRLVGRSRHCDFPPEVQQLPEMGDGFDIHLEALLRLGPDLVIVYDESARDRIQRLGIPAVAVQAETLAEVWTAYRTIAAAAGVPERGERLVARVQAEIEVVHQRYGALPPRRVLFCVDGKSGHVVGPGNFVHELLEKVGAINVAGNAAQRFPCFSLEAALRMDPEVILDSSGLNGVDHDNGLKTFIQGLRETTAGRTSNICAVPYAMITRSGPRLGEAARLLAGLVH
jgi:ABC-type hemin transport system substrate-binding protein